MAAIRQLMHVVGEQSRHRCPLKAALIGSFVAGMLVPFLGSADGSTNPNLNPGVRPGDVVLIREVEPAPIRSVERHGGPITSRVNVRDRAMEVERQLTSGGIVALSDDQAAGVRGSVQNSMGSLHRSLVSDNRLANGSVSSGNSNRAASSLGGGSKAGGISSRVTSATSGIAGTVTGALSPLTGRK